MLRKAFSGAEVTKTDKPDWAPLEAVVGTRLAAWFMWVHEVSLDAECRIQAYKHVATRRYLHVACDGRTFLLRADGRYETTDLARAVLFAFSGWKAANPSFDDQQALDRLVFAKPGRTRDLRDHKGEGSQICQRSPGA